MKFSTNTIHTSSEPQYDRSGDVVTPLHLSTTFARRKVAQPTRGYEYTRTGNPTRDTLERTLAKLEGGKYALAYSSGLAAETNIMLMLKSGDYVVVTDDVYGGTRRLFSQVFSQFGLTFSFVDFTDLVGVERSILPNTKLIWVESPTNPLMKVTDIGVVARLAKKWSVQLVVDNTFASPYYQQPLKLGADIVLHSTTKYLGGHSDTLGGAIVTSNPNVVAKLRFLQNAVGAVMSPFDSWLLLRGIKTLSVRMEQHTKNAKKVAAFLRRQSAVRKVYYPGFSGIISFELAGSMQWTIEFIESLRLIPIAESLGSVESLIEHPASMTHASVPVEERQKIGLSDSLVRLSVGIEDVDDLIQDLSHALQRQGIRLSDRSV